MGKYYGTGNGFGIGSFGSPRMNPFMKPFSWEDVLKARNISYVSEGKNVARGNIAIACPFCGDDPSHHLNLSLNPSAPYYYCFRNPSHSGRNPKRVLERLFGQAEASDILESSPVPSGTGPLEKPAPRSFFIDDIGESTPDDSDIVVEYLQRFRGMEEKTARMVADFYDLRVGRKGPWRARIVLPIVDTEDRILGATGRLLGGDGPRYYTKKGEGCPPFFGAQYVYPFTRSVLLCEGPFDALKLAYYGIREGFSLGAHFVPLAYMGESLTNDHLLFLIKHLYKTSVLFLIPDRDTTPDYIRRSRKMLSQLSVFFDTRVLELPEGVKDPDSLTEGDAAGVLGLIAPLFVPSPTGICS